MPEHVTLLGLSPHASALALDAMTGAADLDDLDALVEELRHELAFAVQVAPRSAHRVLLSWFIVTVTADTSAGKSLRALLPKEIP